MSDYRLSELDISQYRLSEYQCIYCKTHFPDKQVLYDHIRKSDCSDTHYKKKLSQTTSVLNEDTITFGKYNTSTLSKMLRDRKYCMWLLEQKWFSEQYEYLYNRVKNHNPRNYFVLKPHYDLKIGASLQDFLEGYEYFHLCPLGELKLELDTTEKNCYSFYLEMIEGLKAQIENPKKDNPYDIKAPSSWLKKFEERYGIPRDVFKEFLVAYDLPNIPYIVEDIKKMGGIEYKGAKSFIIAKEKSLQQEKFWENILKTYYGEDIGTQYKFRNCFFDFICIKTNTLYECKLGMKDFNEDQHNKYMTTLGYFSLVYLIGNDCIVDLRQQTIYTMDPDKYSGYFLSLKEPNKFEDMVKNFLILEISSFKDYFVL